MGQSTWDHNIYFYCNLIFINKYSNNIIPPHFIRDSNNCDIGNNWSIHIKPCLLMIYLLILVFFRRGNSTNYLYKNSVSKRKIFTYGSDPTTLCFVGPHYVNYIYQSSSVFSNRVTSRSFISQLYQHKNARLLLFLIVYLLITLVCVVKLVKYEEGPLSKRLK